MIPSQMLKGILEGCILSIIAQEETYGYEISEKLKAIGFGEISEGTIYPMLLRLTKNEYIEA
ncbi:MAG: PadR family transcriptional regulator, partial [Erysipelotrichaceae bacterium]